MQKSIFYNAKYQVKICAIACPEPVQYRKAVCIGFLLFFFLFIREYGSTIYVGLARAVSPTNTNFRLTFLLTRLQEALYEDLAV